MDFLCNECAKSFAKEVDLVIHQSRAHDKRHFSCEVCQENFIWKDKHRDHIRKHNKKKETPKKSTCVRLALTKHHTNICSSCPYETPCKRYLYKLQTTNKDKRQTTNNEKWETTTKNKQLQVTNNDQWQTTNVDKQNYSLNAYHKSWSPFFFLKPNVLSKGRHQ